MHLTQPNISSITPTLPDLESGITLLDAETNLTGAVQALTLDRLLLAVTGDVIAFVWVRLRLNRTVDTDRVSDPVVFAPGVGLANPGAGRSVAEHAVHTVC